MPLFSRSGRLVIPGEQLAEGSYKAGQGAVKIGNKIFSKHLGIVKVEQGFVINVIPLKSPYVPSVGDVVIGKIIDVSISSWQVDINSPYPGILQVNEVLPRPVDLTKVNLRDYLDIGDVIVARIIEFDYLRDPILTIKESKLGKVSEGFLLEYNPKITGLILEDENYLVDALENYLKCKVILGRNGRIVLLGSGDEMNAQRLSEISRALGSATLKEIIKPKAKKGSRGSSKCGRKKRRKAR